MVPNLRQGEDYQCSVCPCYSSVEGPYKGSGQDSDAGGSSSYPTVIEIPPRFGYSSSPINDAVLVTPRGVMWYAAVAVGTLLAAARL